MSITPSLPVEPSASFNLIVVDLGAVLLDHLVCPVQHRLRNRQADLLGRLEVYHQLELRRLLHGDISGLGAF
jgi:hypothetical protein